ncbi:insulinase family protein [Myxococcus sp. CA051A]|uniref:M16 family metallopeptidase n=1 Tax=unclassified Myxococcus TaxID=2648731 RepID=UPI00157BB3A1|nr:MULTISPECIES: pitrilysin family protein [unclassified Myxococcus]NTX07547.1 insulinase family protein [Myxococcus sp. CA040A]NTX10776.1 insulinase family protein [Myxococcus sp. CA056]NTX66114.1 insulinase family protein [Myxococcus sp. CA051A]
MRRVFGAVTAAAFLGCAASHEAQKPEAPPAPAEAPAVAAPAPAPAETPKLQVPVDYFKLDNGLKVVLSRDTTAPKTAIGVYYNIGFRIEPKNRTGFAHLFEHMMFQGSTNLGKMEFIRLIQKNGGVLNGSTRFDFTNYFEIVPSNALETMLWAEADRMRGLEVTQENLKNQQGVVSNEVKVNVLNQPYGGFPWLDMPQVANTNWYNAHNFYGDLKDLEAATLDDVKSFFKTYYAPSNAVLVVVGDFEPEQVKGWVKKYFGPLPTVAQPQKPDISEPRQEKEKRHDKPDKLAERPALAVGYHMPAVGTPEYYAMALVDEVLLKGNDSALYQQLVQKKGLAGELQGGVNELGNQWNYNGPMQWTAYLFHDASTSPEAILKEIDGVVAQLQEKPIDAATLARARVKARSRLYEHVESFLGFGRADLLASFALFFDDPERINRLEDELMKVSPELIQKTAREYLRRENRTVLTVTPAPTKAQAR